MALTIAVVADPARALDPPPAASLAALLNDLEATLHEAKQVAGALGIETTVGAAENACAPLLASAGPCAASATGGCAASLVALFANLRQVRATLSARRAAVANTVAAGVFDAASRLAVAREALARGACEAVAAADMHPSQMLLGPDGRSIIVRPLTALHGGRRYAVVARGVDAGWLPELRESLVPKPRAGGLVIPDGSFAAPAERELAGDAGGVSVARTGSLIRRLERDAAAMPGLGAFSGVRVTLPEPVRAAQIGTLQLSFVPAERARAEDTLAVFDVLDARASLLEDRARLAALSCDESTAEPRANAATPIARQANVVALLHGRYRSLDVVGDDTATRSLGIPAAAAQPIELPFLLALPREHGPDTPLVLVVDGHAGSAARILGEHAATLTGRGLAVLAVELPLHGERAVAGRDILDALDPTGFGRNVRQATVDVLAAVQAATRCGLKLPGGERIRVHEVRYFGYSLGAMVGAIARSTEPALGTSVLAAAGGDIFGWLLLRISPALGATFVTCLGGPQEGESCIPTGECAPPGACIVDPYLDLLQWLVAAPYDLAAAAGDPLSYVTRRTGVAGRGRLLLVTGGADPVLYPALATRLADAYGMRPAAPHRRRGPRAQLVQWPELGHDLVDRAGVRAQISEFLASNGRHLLLGEEPARASVPGWYQVFGPSRR